MREEVISSGGTIDPITPAASSAGESLPTVHGNVGSGDGSVHGQGSKGASISYVGSQPPVTSLTTSAGAGGGRGGSGFGTSKLSCRPWERGDLLRRLATFKPSHWSGKPKVISSLACARRGWKNVDVDKVCGAYLTFSLLPTWSPEEDDVLDFTGTSASLGKGSLSDIRHGIITAPILFAMEEFPQLRAVVEQGFDNPANVEIALDYLGKSNGIQRTRELARKHASLAAEAIESLPDEDVLRSRRALLDLTHIVITRIK